MTSFLGLPFFFPASGAGAGAGAGASTAFALPFFGFSSTGSSLVFSINPGKHFISFGVLSISCLCIILILVNYFIF